MPVRPLDPINRTLEGIPKIGGTPSQAEACYEFDNTNFEEAVTETVYGVNKATDSNPTERDILQSATGLIKTFPAGTVAFDQGVGAVVEPVGVTDIPSDMTLWIDSDGCDVAYEPVSGINTLTFTGGNTAHRVFHASAVTIGLSYVTSLFVSKTGWRYMQVTGSAGFDTDVLNVDLVSGAYNLQAGTPIASVTDAGDKWRIVFIQDAVSTVAGGRSLICAANDLNSPRLPNVDANDSVFEILYPNFNQASNATSPIHAPTGPAQRDPSQLKVSNFIESERWADNGSGGVAVVLGDRNGGGYTDGVSTAFGFMRFDLGDTLAGKYAALVVSDWVGAILTATNGVVVEVAGINTASIFSITMIHNPTGLDDSTATIQGFGNDGTSSNPFTIDFRPSAYFNSSSTLAADTLVVDALRTNAGDDVSGMPAAAMIPANGWEITVELDYKFDFGSSTRIFDSTFDADNRVLIYKDSANPMRVLGILEVGGVSLFPQANLASNIESGDHIIASLSLSASNQLSITVTNVTKSETATSAPLAAAAVTDWPAYSLIGTDATGANMVAGEYSTLKLTDLTKSTSGTPFKAFYDHSRLDIPLQDQVTHELEINTERGSDANIEQLDGTIETFVAGEAALVRGESMVIEDVEVNELSNSSDPTTYTSTISGTGTAFVLTPNYALAPDGTMTAHRLQMSINGGGTTNDYTRFRTLTGATTSSVDYTQSWHMRSNDANTYQVGSLIKSQTTSDNYEVTTEWRRLSKTNNLATQGNNQGLQLRGGFGQSDTIDILIWMSPKMGHQLEQAPQMSSFIFADGAPAQREATIATASTFTEVGSAIDSPSDNGGANPCVLGNITSGDFIKGVDTVNQFLSFGGSPLGKYNSLVTVEHSNLLMSSEDGSVIIRCLYRNAGGYSYTLIKGVDADVQSKLEYPNNIIVDFTTSDYFTPDMAAFRLAIDTLRTNAGDNATWLASLPAPKQWPIDSFELVLDHTLLAIPEDNDVLFSGQVGDGSLERFNIYKTSADVVAVQHRVAGVDTIVNSGYLLTQPDERLTIIARLTGGQLTLEVNGMSNSGADGGVVTWGSEAGIAQKPDGSFRSPMKVHSLKIKEL